MFHPLRSIKQTTHDLVQMMMGGGSDQPILPHFGGNRGPTEKQAYSGIRQGVTSITGADAIASMHDHPSLKHLAMMAASLPTGGGGVHGAVALPLLWKTNRGIGAAKDSLGGVKALRKIRMLHDKADAEQVISYGASEHLDEVYKMLGAAPHYKGGKLRHGRLYQLDPHMVRPGAIHEKDTRLAIIQDPKSGAMFASPGDFHHGELMGAVDRIKYMRDNPGVHLDPSGVWPKSEFNGWMQHEVFAKRRYKSLHGRLPDQITPGRVNFTGADGLHPDNVDTPAATIGRMRLLRDLHRYAGYGTVKTSEDGTSALTRLMRDKYNITPGKRKN